MNDKVRRFIAENSLISEGDRVIAALSGGADSTSLLYVLNFLKEELKIEIYAAHFNHGIRGAEADRDERFAGELCDRLGIRLFTGRADIPAVSAQTGESEELCGRRLRYDFLGRVADKLGSALIATAHNLDDNSETVLWNLTRGSGIGGLCGIPARRGNIIRPLLSCSRAEIEEYCRENGLEFVTDSTNLDDKYTRNRLRHRVMPVLRELNANADENIARTSALMREADDYLNNISEKELKAAKTQYGYSCSKLLKADGAVLKYAVKNLLTEAKAPVDSRHIELTVEAMKNGGAVKLGQGYTAVCAQGILRIATDKEDNGDICIPAKEYIKEHGAVFHVRNGVIEYPDGYGELSAEEYKKINNLLLKHGVRCDIITSDTFMRRRRAGDTFTDKRRGVTKTVKKLLNELKIPRELRDDLRVLARGSEVLWLECCGASAQAKADLTLDGDIILLTGDK